MFGNVFTLGSIRGIPIRIDASWVIIASLITWSFWGQFTVMYGQPADVALVMAVLGAAGFFGSVLAHELAHALEARNRGVTVRGITLFLFGGVTESKFDVRRPGDEFALTIVGPLTSLALAGAFGVVANLAGPGLEGLAQVTGLLAWINLALALFNLIPGAPLDGGRLLRAAIWKATGDRQRSIRLAAQAGQAVGGLLIAGGVALVLFVAGALFSGLWLALIGWFLRRGAAAELAQARLCDMLSQVPARQVAQRPRPVDESDTVGSILDRWSYGEDPDFLPVARDGRLAGVVSIERARRAADHRSARVRDVMTPLSEVPTVAADEPASAALDALADTEVVVALDGDTPVGLISAERLVAAAERRARLLAGERAAAPR
jgi:Zn-dependent protease